VDENMRIKMFNTMKFYFLFIVFVGFFSFGQRNALPVPFSDVQEGLPSAVLDLRYYGSDNFIGRPIAGYVSPKAVLTTQALNQLKKVQEELKKFQLGIKIFDAYRPQRAVDDFVKWAKVTDDTLMKARFYPDVAKKDLFKLDYIASKSGHSRGSTLDLTLVSLKTSEALDMGSPYDFFGKISWPFAKEISPKQRAHRMLLRTLMLKYGFQPYCCEWWHFTLKSEPFPATYFDFIVE
jgi:D-alanyl-D-alanine dipeptidase